MNGSDEIYVELIPFKTYSVSISFLYQHDKTRELLLGNLELRDEIQVGEHLDAKVNRAVVVDVARAELESVESGKFLLGAGQERAVEAVDDVDVGDFHVEQQKLLRQLVPRFRLLHPLVHHRVHDGDPAVNGERRRRLLVALVEVKAVDFIAQLGDADDAFLVADGKAEDVAGLEARLLVDALVEKRMLICVVNVEEFAGLRDMSGDSLRPADANLLRVLALVDCIAVEDL